LDDYGEWMTTEFLGQSCGRVEVDQGWSLKNLAMKRILEKLVEVSAISQTETSRIETNRIVQSEIKAGQILS
jgi:hypothetical protein